MDRQPADLNALSPQASVVVPTWNRAPMLRRCLEALALQDHSSFEVIVVDDASSDATQAVLKEVAAAHPDFRLRWLRNDHHAGANSGRNRAVYEARGEFVAFTDDDCVPHRDWLRALMRGFSADKVGAVTGTVLDVPPTNLYELAYKGTHRVIVFGVARRLLSGNMAVRHRLLLELKWHEDCEPSDTPGPLGDILLIVHIRAGRPGRHGHGRCFPPAARGPENASRGARRARVDSAIPQCGRAGLQ